MGRLARTPKTTWPASTLTAASSGSRCSGSRRSMTRVRDIGQGKRRLATDPVCTRTDLTCAVDQVPLRGGDQHLGTATPARLTGEGAICLVPSVYQDAFR